MTDPSWELIETIRVEREITAVLHRYCHAVDRRDEDELRSVYHPGATDDHGSYSGSAEGFVQWVLDRLPRTYGATQHSLSNISIDVQGEVAFSESYVTAGHVVLPHAGGGLYTFVGRYVDRFERRDHGGWRIVHRKLLRSWESVLPLSRSSADGFELPETSPHTDGLRSRSDPSYSRIAD